MSDPKTPNGLIEQQLAGAAVISRSILDGFDHASRLQSAGLQHFGTVVTAAFDHQRDRYAALQRLVEQLRATRDPSVVLQAQQEWLNDEIKRYLSNATWWLLADTVTPQEANSRPGRSDATTTVSEISSRRPPKAAAE